MSDRMRLLFTASPAYGHLLPLLPMIRAAMTAGHDVRLATGPDMVGPMRSRSVPAYGVGATWDEIVAERDEEAGRSPRRGPRRPTRGLGQRAVRAARRPGGCRACWTWPAAGDRTSSCTSRSSSAASCSPGTSDCPASPTATARCSASTARWVRSSPARPATRACGTRCSRGPRSTSVLPRCAHPAPRCGRRRSTCGPPPARPAGERCSTRARPARCAVRSSTSPSAPSPTRSPA